METSQRSPNLPGTTSSTEIPSRINTGFVANSFFPSKQKIWKMENYISTARNGHQFIDFSRFARQSVFRSIGFFTFTKTKKVFPFFELQQPKKKKINSIKEKRKSCLFFFRVIPGRLISTCVCRRWKHVTWCNVTVDALPKLSSQVTFTFYFN